MLRGGFMLLSILFVYQVSSSTLPPLDVPQGHPGREPMKYGSSGNTTTTTTSSYTNATNTTSRSFGNTTTIATLSGGSPTSSATPMGGSTTNTTPQSFGNTTGATTPSDDPVDDEEDSFFSSGVITQTLVEAFNWIFTNFIKLIADRVERTNSTEEVYIGA
ncbi:hypothetical protein TELCIR_21451 [Teladorsagia circumcincta]|uniref:Uncharacterized protein n=1 Tax=Teladorsagia circumcincta TaxID=45464 RepID=A0A2G9TGS3_TELCI|nr:hypothetical protein TELCIR_21451 [Teladorsagia circumcincta]